MGGYKRTLDDDQWRHANNVGVHFGIGRDGSIDQYTSILDASWGNGVAGSILKYDRTNPRLAALEGLGNWVSVHYAGTLAYALVSGGTNVINCHTISTEHEDETIDQPWTPEMIDATIRVKRWCLEALTEAGIEMPVSIDMLAGHFQIDAVNRANCPGDNWPKQGIYDGITYTEDDMAIELVWNPDFGRMYVVGQGVPIWVTNQANAADLERAYGPPKRALAWATLLNLGATS